MDNHSRQIVKKKEKDLAIMVVAIIMAVALVSILGFVMIKPLQPTIQGQVDAEEIRISGALPGRVEKIYVNEGDRVTKGDTLVKIYSSLMEAKLMQAKAMEQVASATNKKVDSLYAMVENLLDFSRLQNTTFSLSKEKLDLVAEVYDAVIMYMPQAEKHGIEINFEEPEIFIPIMADKNRVRQVMINLIDNAIKYSEENSVIEVNITCSKDNNTASVEVKDYGKGIHPDDISKVKGKFYKGKGAKRGSGIGLALVSEIMQLHGGRFDIESEYGKYTSMQVTFRTVPAVKGK